jgi:N-formylglutamate amidohydrolase
VSRPRHANGFVIAGVIERHDPAGAAAPLVFDSPHSGAHYPADFAHAAPREVLRRAEDAFVDELVAAAPRSGATLLRALFPRSYIDPNREVWDIDPDLLTGPWPGRLRPGRKTRLGVGLIRRYAVDGVPVYRDRLAPAAVRARIDGYYRPYRAELGAALDQAHRAFGAVWHVNWHSMKSAGSKITPEGKRTRRADIVLGDLDGRACEPAFTAFVAEVFAALGYTVAINKPYKGASLIARHGAPQRRRHSLQIEINRRLYMHEDRVEKHEGFERLKGDLAEVTAAIGEYARSKLGAASP